MWDKMMEMFKRDWEKVKTLDYRKKRNFIMLIGGIFFISMLIYLPFYYTVTPGFCNSCHLMKPYYRTWNTSSHRRFFCTGCHVEPGISNLIASRFVGVNDAWNMFFGSKDKPLRVEKPSNNTCLQCHTKNRMVSPNGDILIPHQDHVNLRHLLCVDCHTNLIHFKNPQGNFRPSMNICYKCHDGKKAPNQCTTCHTSMAATREHNFKNWNKKGHAEKAEFNRKSCDRCHGAFPTFCIDCHKKNSVPISAR